jgi:hypothetical protein
MKRVAWILTVLGILCLAGSQAQADNRHHGGHPAYYGHHCGPVVRPQVWIGPRVIVPVAPPPAVVYPPAYPYAYPYYAPVPSGGIYFRGRGLSLGVGW